MEKKRVFIWVISLLLSLCLAYLWWRVIGYLQDYLNLPPRPLVGNWPSNVSALKEEGFPFSFLVIGDTSGSATSETLIEKALKKDHPSFLVILGDFVKKPDLWNHRFFLTEMTAEIAPPFPVFLVAGNHDIDYTGSNIRRKDRGVTPEIYESLYGERNFDFIFNDCLFIICGVDVKSPHLFLAHLRKTLLLKGRGREHIFVFIHYPPKGLADHIEGSLPVPREEEFLGLLEEYKVTACFFGDYHGHWRGQKGGVNLIVSGGGGRLKPSQPEWGKFHHILKITVEPKKIVEEVITAPQQFGLEDRFEEWVFTNIFPSLGTSLKVYYLIFIGLIVVAGGFLLQLNRSLRIFPKRLSSQKENLSENHP